MEKKERQTLEMKIIVDTKELDEAIEKINSLIELGKEFQKLNLSSTAQEDRERLKDLEIERIASKLTSRLREQINLVSRTPEESQQVEGRRKQCDDGDDQSESTDDTRIPVKVTADLKKVKSAIKCAIRHIRAFAIQSAQKRVADYGEPCENCEQAATCYYDWFTTMQPLLDESLLNDSKEKISVVCPVQTDTQGNDHKDLAQGTDIPRNEDKSNCPFCNPESCCQLC